MPQTFGHEPFRLCYAKKGDKRSPMKAMKRTFLSLAPLLFLSASLVAQDADETALDQFDKAKPTQSAFDSPASVELRDAVRRMAIRPNDPVALSDAGYASLKLGDAGAALNFFSRSNSLQPGNSRTVAGLASAMVRTENPFEALRYFDEAIRLGANERSIALDRAVAFDLLGNFAKAQQDYQLARAFTPGDELTRRQAISMSMAGMANEADGLLVPLLQKNDPQAWRARSMMLAARGQLKEAVQISQGFLSADAARRMETFLRQMPKMTDAQRAAAMHFGHFPVGRIGEDTPEIRRIASANPPAKVASAAVGQDRLIPVGAPLGNSDRNAVGSKKTDKKPKREERRMAKADAAPGFTTQSAQQKIDAAAKARPVTIAAVKLPPPDTARPAVKVILPAALPPPAPAVSPIAAPQPTTRTEIRPQTVANTSLPPATTTIPAQSPMAAGSQPPIAATPPAASVPPAVQPAPAAVAIPGPVNASAPPISGPLAATGAAVSAPSPAAQQGPMPDGGAVAAAASVTTAPSTVAAIAPAPSSPPPTPSDPAPSSPIPATPFNLDAVIQSIEVPESERTARVAAVDLKAIQRTQARAAQDAAVKDKARTDPKKPVDVARIWVQVATGNEAAMGGDYGRLARKSPDLFKGKDGWTSPWGKSSRLLVGPFADTKAAKKWEADFRKTGGSGFVWQSESGTPVKKLGSK